MVRGVPSRCISRPRNLNISVRELQICITFIALLFTRVHVIVWDPPSSHDCYRFFSTLTKHCSPDALTDVGVIHGKPCPTTPDCALETQMLEPLFACPNIEAVHICTPFTYDHVNNGLLESVALAWPQLRLLRISNNLQSFLHGSADLQGLLHLTRCSKLESVDLAFNVSIPPTTASFERRGSGVCYELMTTLRFSRLPITNPRAVAIFLCKVFPNLLRIETWPYYKRRRGRRGRGSRA